MFLSSFSYSWFEIFKSIYISLSILSFKMCVFVVVWSHVKLVVNLACDTPDLESANSKQPWQSETTKLITV